MQDLNLRPLGPKPSALPNCANRRYSFVNGVTDGARTHDNRNHNPGLYQLSYNHHGITVFSKWRTQKDSNLRPTP